MRTLKVDKDRKRLNREAEEDKIMQFLLPSFKTVVESAVSES